MSVNEAIRTINIYEIYGVKTWKFGVSLINLKLLVNLFSRAGKGLKITRENIRIVELINRIFMQSFFLIFSLWEISSLSYEGKNLSGHDSVKNKALTDGERSFNRTHNFAALKKVKANLWKTRWPLVHSMFINQEDRCFAYNFCSWEKKRWTVDRYLEMKLDTSGPWVVSAWSAQFCFKTMSNITKYPHIYLSKSNLSELYERRNWRTPLYKMTFSELTAYCQYNPWEGKR